MPIEVVGGGTVLNASVYEFPGRILVAEPQPFGLELTEELPDIPARPETLLAMEFQLRERSVDLAEISSCILDDLGATIQILRLAGAEYGNSEGRPVRIEDCIADLGLRACLRAAASRTPVTRALGAFLDFQSHSREIARFSMRIAEGAPHLANPSEAYLAGFLHGIGALPDLLGWHRNDLPANSGLAAVRIAERWALPGFLQACLRELLASGKSGRWAAIVCTAHRLAKGPRACCPLAGSGA